MRRQRLFGVAYATVSLVLLIGVPALVSRMAQGSQPSPDALFGRWSRPSPPTLTFLPLASSSPAPATPSPASSPQPSGSRTNSASPHPATPSPTTTRGSTLTSASGSQSTPASALGASSGPRGTTQVESADGRYNLTGPSVASAAGTTLATWYLPRPDRCWDLGRSTVVPPTEVYAAAHYPCGTTIQVDGPDGTVTLQVWDHGPWGDPRRGLDLSPAAFQIIGGSLRRGIVSVVLTVR
jgi:hypothetical protein